MLNAVLLSQYRKRIAQSLGIMDFKPVILFKSNKIAVSNATNVKFNDMIIPGLDNKYLFINYIDDLSYKSKVKDKCFVKDDLNICVVNDNTINVTSSNLVLNYEISDVGTVEDFDVKI